MNGTGKCHVLHVMSHIGVFRGIFSAGLFLQITKQHLFSLFTHASLNLHSAIALAVHPNLVILSQAALCSILPDVTELTTPKWALTLEHAQGRGILRWIYLLQSTRFLLGICKWGVFKDFHLSVVSPAVRKSIGYYPNTEGVCFDRFQIPF